MQGVVLPIVRATEGEVPMCCMGFLLHLLFPVCPLMCALVMSSHAVSVIYSSHKNIHCKKLGSFLQTYSLPLELPVWAHAQLHEMTRLQSPSGSAAVTIRGLFPLQFPQLYKVAGGGRSEPWRYDLCDCQVYESWESFPRPKRQLQAGHTAQCNVGNCFPGPSSLVIVRALICSAAGLSPRNHYRLILLFAVSTVI